MNQDVALRDCVIRRVGGLEEYSARRLISVPVIRRVGGLEDRAPNKSDIAKVIRRVGGLEAHARLR